MLPRLGQVSVEYLMIMSFVFLMTIPMLAIFLTQSNEMQDSISLNQATNVARKIATASESVYYLGYPSRTTIRAYMPQNVQSIFIGSNEIVITVDTTNGPTEIVEYTPINVTGIIGSFSGIQRITVQAMPDYVNITSE